MGFEQVFYNLTFKLMIALTEEKDLGCRRL